MTVEEFEALKCGDCIREESSGEVSMINQVRLPGFYAVVRVDPKTFDRVSNQLHSLRSGEGFALVQKKAVR